VAASEVVPRWGANMGNFEAGKERGKRKKGGKERKKRNGRYGRKQPPQ